MAVHPPQPTVKQVLLGIDFSSAVDAAKERAVALCLCHGARLTLVHSLEVSSLPPGLRRPPPRMVDRYRELATESLNKLSRELGQRLPAVATRLHEAPAHRALVEVAEELNPDLIVMGSQGVRSLDRFLLGSTARRVLQQSRWPVLVVPPSAGRRAGPIGKILLATDLSRDAELAAAISAALTCGRGERPHFTLFNACPTPLAGVAEGTVSASAGFLQRAKAQSLEALKESASRLSGHEIHLEIKVRDGDPATAIVAEAEEGDYDLIAMGTRGLAGVKALLLGSTAERVLQQATCAVLLVNRRLKREEERGPGRSASAAAASR